MRSWSMVVADSARARIFSVDWSDDVKTESSPKLRELDALVNPDAQLREHDDEHRAERKRTLSLRFAQRIAQRVGERPGVKWIVAADKRMLGHLRRAIHATAAHVEPIELAADLTRQPGMRILEALAQRGIVEARRVPAAGVFRAKGLEAQHG
jgi:hypothetical protein